MPAEDRNLVKVRFPVGAGRTRFTGWPIVSDNDDITDRAIVADLRRASAVPGSEDETKLELTRVVTVRPVR